MDVLIVNPRGTSAQMPPLGLMYICAVLREGGFKASVIDAEIEKMDDAQLENIFKKEKPAIVGVPMFTPTYSQALNVLRIAKNVDSSTKTVVGGPHATALPEIADHNLVDFVVRGEGEMTFLELANFIIKGKGDRKKIKGISYKDGNKVNHNPNRELIQNLDELPGPRAIPCQ